MKLNRVRECILPAAVLVSAGVTIWVDSLRGTDVTRDDVCPAALTIILSVWALLDIYFRRFWRATSQMRLSILAEGVAAAVREQAAGNGETPTRGRPGGGASSPPPPRP